MEQQESVVEIMRQRPSAARDGSRGSVVSCRGTMQQHHEAPPRDGHTGRAPVRHRLPQLAFFLPASSAASTASRPARFSTVSVSRNVHPVPLRPRHLLRCVRAGGGNGHDGGASAGGGPSSRSARGSKVFASAAPARKEHHLQQQRHDQSDPAAAPQDNQLVLVKEEEDVDEPVLQQQQVSRRVRGRRPPVGWAALATLALTGALAALAAAAAVAARRPAGAYVAVAVAFAQLLAARAAAASAMRFGHTNAGNDAAAAAAAASSAAREKGLVQGITHVADRIDALRGALQSAADAARVDAGARHAALAAAIAALDDRLRDMHHVVDIQNSTISSANERQNAEERLAAERRAAIDAAELDRTVARAERAEAAALDLQARVTGLQAALDAARDRSDRVRADADAAVQREFSARAELAAASRRLERFDLVREELETARLRLGALDRELEKHTEWSENVLADLADAKAQIRKLVITKRDLALKLEKAKSPFRTPRSILSGLDRRFNRSSSEEEANNLFSEMEHEKSSKVRSFLERRQQRSEDSSTRVYTDYDLPTIETAHGLGAPSEREWPESALLRQSARDTSPDSILGIPPDGGFGENPALEDPPSQAVRTSSPSDSAPSETSTPAMSTQSLFSFSRGEFRKYLDPAESQNRSSQNGSVQNMPPKESSSDHKLGDQGLALDACEISRSPPSIASAKLPTLDPQPTAFYRDEAYNSNPDAQFWSAQSRRGVDGESNASLKNDVTTAVATTDAARTQEECGASVDIQDFKAGQNYHSAHNGQAQAKSVIFLDEHNSCDTPHEQSEGLVTDLDVEHTSLSGSSVVHEKLGLDSPVNTPLPDGANPVLVSEICNGSERSIMGEGLAAQPTSKTAPVTRSVVPDGIVATSSSVAPEEVVPLFSAPSHSRSNVQKLLEEANDLVKEARRPALSVPESDVLFSLAADKLTVALESSGQATDACAAFGSTLLAWARSDLQGAFARERLEESSRLLALALEGAPKDQVSLFNRGLCICLVAAAHASDNGPALYAEACRMYDQFLEIVPSSHVGSFNCGLAYISRARLSAMACGESAESNQFYLSAKTRFEQCIKLRPSDKKAKRYVDECAKVLSAKRESASATLVE